MKTAADVPAWYLRLVWLLLPLGAIVFIEPSPYDLMMIIVLAIGLYCSFIAFPAYLGVPLLFLTLFLISNLLPVLFMSQNHTYSMKYFMITLYLIGSWLFFVGLNYRCREKALKVIFSGYVAAALLSSIIGILAYFHWIPGHEFFMKYDRVTGLFKDPNVYGPFLVPAVVIALHHMVTTKRKNMLWGSAFIILNIAVLLSFSRAAWANCVISCFFYVLVPYRESFKKKMIVLLSILILIVPMIGYVITRPDVNHLFTDRFGMKAYDEDRFGTQLKALMQVLETPIGIGPGQSELVYDYATHSLYVRVITEYGIAGFIFFAIFILLTVFRAFAKCCSRGSPLRPYFIVFFACLIGILFNSFFIDTLHWRHFWFLLALPWLPSESHSLLHPFKEGPHENRSNHYAIR